jgi:hypothetical protein
MTKMSDNPSPSLLFEDHVDPAAPADGYHRLFIDTDEKLKMIDHASLVTDFTPGAETLPVSIIAAKGDLIVGTANDTAGILTAGTNTHVLTADSTQTTGLKWAAAAGGGSVATDAIWDAAGDLAVGTGADTAAVLTKGAAGGVLAMGNAAVIWNAGTSFPGSKATGDRYWRTDLGLECYWDGTRWVSTTLYTATLQTFGVLQPIATDNGNGPAAGLWGAKYDIWLVDWIQAVLVQTTNDAGNYWTIYLWDNLGNVLASFNTTGYTAGTYGSTTTALNAALASGRKSLQLSLNKTSTPGTIFVPGIVTYRLIVT